MQNILVSHAVTKTRSQLVTENCDLWRQARTPTLGSKFTITQFSSTVTGHFGPKTLRHPYRLRGTGVRALRHRNWYRNVLGAEVSREHLNSQCLQQCSSDALAMMHLMFLK